MVRSLAKICLTLIPSVIAAADLPEGTTFAEVLAFGASYHTNRSAPWSETNPGAGVALATVAYAHVDARFSVGTYQDSYGDQAYFAMPGLAYVIGGRRDLHASLGINLGFMRGSGFDGVGCLPILGIGYDRVEMCITGIPEALSREDDRDGRSWPKTGLIAAFLRVRAASW